MTTEMVELKENMTVEKAFQIIKNTGIDKETIYICYVVLIMSNIRDLNVFTSRKYNMI